MSDRDNGIGRVTRSFDPAELRAICDDDLVLGQQLAKLFAEGRPRLLAELRRSIAVGETESCYAAAHQLKGSVANLGATDARELAVELERMASRQDLSEGKEVLFKLETELNRLEQELNAFFENDGRP